MAFHLTERDRVGNGLARIVKKELRKAVEELERSRLGSEAVHEVRKHVKKLRAIGRLVESAVGKPVRRADKRLRRIGRDLSALRDVDVATETLEHVRNRQPDPMLTRAVAIVSRGLELRRRRVLARATEDDLKDACAKAFRKVKRLTKRWHLEQVRTSAVLDAMRDTYRDARDAMDVARERQRAADFHKWRKRAKALFYQFRLLETRADLSERIENLRRLEEWLGEDHNLVVLQAFVAHAPARIIHRRHLARLTAACKAYQRQLRQDALALGTQLFAAKPGALTEALRDAA